MVWASYSQFQPAVRTRKKQFVCLCHAQQPVSTTSHNQFELVSTTRKNQFWASHNQFLSQGKMVWASYSQFQPAVRTRKGQFVCLCHAQQPVSTTSHNQFELVSTTRKNQFWASHNQFQSQGKMVWASYSQFQQAVRTRKKQFVCLCHAQQPVSTTSHNQFQLVSITRKNQFWASHNEFQSQGKMVRASYSQFQPAVRTRKNQFFCLCHAQQPVSTTSHNQFELVSTTRKNQFWASHNQFQSQGKWFELVTASSMTRKNRSEPVFWGTCLFVSCTTGSFNNQEEPVSASHSQFQSQGKTGLS